MAGMKDHFPKKSNLSRIITLDTYHYFSENLPPSGGVNLRRIGRISIRVYLGGPPNFFGVLCPPTYPF